MHTANQKIQSFVDLSLHSLLRENLAQHNFIKPTPIQAAALKPALEGRDVLGTARTGSGKTLAFILPILMHLMQHKGHGIEALVLVPTRELAMQIIDTLRHVGRGSGISAAIVVGGLAESKQLAAIRGGARLVIATPGRLGDYLMRRLVNLGQVKILVLDEADRMVDMGFLPQMRVIMNALSREHQTMCFCATLEKSVARLVHEYLKNPVRVEVDSTTKPAESVVLKVYQVVREQKLPLLVHLLETQPGTFLVFTRTKHGADKLFKKLIQRGIDAGVLHGGKSQSQRTRALEGFKKGAHRVLVATDIAARGIHVDDIAHVINYDMPQAAEDFIHRVGRTGRVEATGVATTFVMPEEAVDIHSIERILGKKIERISLPEGLAQEPRSIHDEVIDFRARGARHFRSTRHFGRRKRY